MVHNKIKAFKCDKCEKMFSTNQTLNIHIDRVHENLRPWKCERCDKRFGVKENLNKHVERIHENVKINCTVCDKALKKDCLRSHMEQVHEKQRPWKCLKCGNCFGFKRGLDIHMESVHENVKHQCLICDRAYTQMNRLKIHMKKHSHCELCKRSFVKQGHYEKHLAENHTFVPTNPNLTWSRN